MDTETRRLLIIALYYTEASLEDMKWHRSITDLDGINTVTNGTKCFDTEEEFEEYMADKKNYVDELKAVLNCSDMWEVPKLIKEVSE